MSLFSKSIFIFCLIFIFTEAKANKSSFSDKEINEMMKIAANTYSKSLPIVIDEVTSVIAIFAGNNRDLVYKYKIKTKKNLNSSERKAIINRFRPIILRQETNNYCTQPGLEVFRKNNITLEHNVVDVNNNYLFDVRIDNKFCN